MRGINPGYLDKLDAAQRQWAITGPGKMFLDDFVWLKGNHCFVIGTTGSGKTNKGYWLVNWLKHTEMQVWLDSGKSNEIIPLLCQGLPVHIIVPKYTDVIIEEKVNGKWERIKDHPVVTHIPDAGDTWWALRKKTINILCFRNAFWTTSAPVPSTLTNHNGYSQVPEYPGMQIASSLPRSSQRTHWRSAAVEDGWSCMPKHSRISRQQLGRTSFVRCCVEGQT
jgi:hypothetical protein